MNGFQPITYGPSTKIDNTEVLQKLTNIQAYTGLILNNMGIAVDTGLILPEFNYIGSAQPDYLCYLGANIAVVCRNYDYTLGINMEEMTSDNYLEVKFSYDGTTYTAFPKLVKISGKYYFQSEVSYFCPIQVSVGENGCFSSNFSINEGRCGIKFTLDTSITPRAPMSLLYLGAPRLRLIS